MEDLVFRFVIRDGMDLKVAAGCRTPQEIWVAGIGFQRGRGLRSRKGWDLGAW